MSKRLHLSKDFSLPATAITQTFGVLGKRGSGKSNLGTVMAEEMHKAGLPFVVVDPVSAWWGLRSSGSGKGPGLPIPIFGGEHGDVPLERTGGQLLADLVVDQRLSCVLDVSEFSEGDKIRFLIDYAERLFRRNRDPLHLFLEEADDYAPQRPMRDAVRMLGAWQRVVKRGRSRGLGATSITQRSASLNKDVLTQTETLFVFRTTSPQDRKAIEGWLEFHGQSKEVLESLPSLRDGECWVWSPHWLGQLERVQIRRRETFDSGATPTDLSSRRSPASLADVDLGKIRKEMAATIERAKQTDPKELQREVARLRADLARQTAQVGRQTSPAKVQAAPVKERLVEVPVLKDSHLQRFERAVGVWVKGVDQLGGITTSVGGMVRDLQGTLAKVRANGAGPPLSLGRRVSPAEMPAPRPVLVTRRARPNASATMSPSVALPIGEEKVLRAVAQYPDGVTRAQLTVLTGYARSTRDTYLKRLGAKGFVSTGRGDRVLSTDAGRAGLGDRFEPLPTGDDLRAYWLTRLPEGERRIFAALLDAFPNAVDREALSEMTGYARSTRDTYLKRLGAKQLIERRGREGIGAAEQLFDDRLVPA